MQKVWAALTFDGKLLKIFGNEAAAVRRCGGAGKGATSCLHRPRHGARFAAVT